MVDVWWWSGWWWCQWWWHECLCVWCCVWRCVWCHVWSCGVVVWCMNDFRLFWHFDDWRTDRWTDEQTFVLLESLLRLKNINKSINWDWHLTKINNQMSKIDNQLRSTFIATGKPFGFKIIWNILIWDFLTRDCLDYKNKWRSWIVIWLENFKNSMEFSMKTLM